MTTGPRAPVLRLQGIQKAFPGVQAIRSADLDLQPGEIHALVGENGAGKSTLIKVIAGAQSADSGTMEFEGRPYLPLDPASAIAQGVGVIYQEFNLVPSLSVRDNLFLGKEPRGRWRIDRSAERQRALPVLEALGAAIDLETAVSRLNVAQQQLVEIVRSLLSAAQLLILDEPTAALTPREAERLFETLLHLKDHGMAILFVSHRLEEVFRLADRVSVMRDGSMLGTWKSADLDRDRLVELMVGRPLDQEFPKVTAPIGEPLLVVRDLWGGKVRGVSFSVHRGEVLGIAGLVGAGRTDLARLLFGADRPTSGTIEFLGRPLAIRTPREAIERGICLLTEDRKAEGLALGRSALENFALPNLRRWSHRGWIDRKAESAAFERWTAALNLKVTGPGQPAGLLSGGNQQKLLIGRWLAQAAQVLIFDEPTRGVDVGAKYEIYLLINQLAAQGKAIVMISSELPEILGMSDRILVLRNGEVSGELTDARKASQEQVLKWAVS